MSLAFDKQGRPFAWHKRTAKLRVRLFRNPSARGTCCQVLDALGAPLFVDVDVDYAEFRRAVGGAPGLYRLDQCDEDGVEIDDAAPAYVSIDQLRNAGAVMESASPGDVSPLLIIERLVSLHADVMKTMAGQHAAILASSAEVMRAPYRPIPQLPATALRNADAVEEVNDEENDDDDDDAIEEASPFGPMLHMIEPHLPKLGAFLYQKFIEFFRHASTAPATTSPAATSAPSHASATVVTASQASVQRVDVTAGTAPSEAAFDAQTFDEEAFEIDNGPIASATPVSPLPFGSDMHAPNPSASPADLQPTPEQLTHLFAVRERLSPAEQTLVEHVIKRMAPEMLSQYLGTLSAMSIDEAVAFIRSMVAQSRPGATAGSR